MTARAFRPHRPGVPVLSALRRIKSAPALATDTLHDLRVTASYADLSRAVQCEVQITLDAPESNKTLRDHALAACVATPPDPSSRADTLVEEQRLLLLEDAVGSSRRRREPE